MDNDFREKRPVHIDVYTDASVLCKGQRNPEVAAGWGAAVIETYKNGARTLWLPSDPCHEGVKNSSGAEIEAGIKALQAIKTRESYRPSDDPMPSITLYSDQIKWPEQIKKYQTRADKTAKSPMDELAALTIEMNAQAKYTKHDKTGQDDPNLNSRIMDYPHKLASRAAWTQRIEKQGGAAYFSEPIQISKDEDIEEIMRKLMPIRVDSRGM